MAGIIDEGLCLRTWDWSETSQTAMVFTRGLGIVRGLAKGAKRPKHPYSGGLEMLTRGRVGVIVRPTSELALITSWDLVETFPALRQSLRVHNAGLYIADVLQHAIHDHDPHATLYDQVIESLRLLAGEPGAAVAEGRIAPAMLKFQWAALVETGYKPELDTDVRTGEPLDMEKPLAFAPTLGGFVVSDAMPGETPAPNGQWRVRAQTLHLLKQFSGGGLEALVEIGGGSGDEPGESLAMERANRLLASYIRYVLAAEPATMPLVFGSNLAR